MRGKIVVGSLLIVLLPLAVVLAMGIRDALVRRDMAAQLRTTAALLVNGAGEHRLAARGPDAWLDRFAAEHEVFIRVVDRDGALLASTATTPGEGRLAHKPWFERATDWLFGLRGTPDLLAYEAGLPPAADRPEVAAALRGEAAETWREPESGKMFVFYRAEPLPGGGGAVYLTRLARRNLRALYDLRSQLLRITLLLALGVAVVALWVARHFVRPVSRIQRAVHAYLQTGDPVSIALDRRDEIGDLSRDVDELARKLQERIADTAQSTADLAHDLKSPLSTITASVELLAAGEPLDDDRRRRIADAVKQAAAHMSRSVQAMLALARLDESLPRAERRPVSLAELAERVCTGYREDPRYVQARLSVERDGDPVLLGVDERLAQALGNLLDNALGHCRHEVRVRVSATATEAVLAVLDDGPGVSPGNRDKVFARFFSVRAPGQEPGSGLALAIVQAVAKAHGGRVELRPCELGGACFAIILPLG